MVDASTPDPFGDTPQHTPGEPPPEVKRDQYGRYLIPHPDTGKRQAWTRVTTFAKSVADMYNIDLYHNRLVAKGMAMRPDLYAEAATAHIEDKKTLDRLAELAMEAAGKSAKARLGTALHAFTEKADRGEKQNVPKPWDADVDAYTKGIAEHRIEVLPEFIEATVVIPRYGVAGTLDRLLRVEGQPNPLVGDLKTGHSVQWAWMEIACQLYLYSQATHIYDHRTEELVPFPKVDQERAIVMHLPVGEATLSLYEVDLELGGRVAAVSDVVRELRKRKNFATAWESSVTGATALAFASGGDDWDADETAEQTNAGDWDEEMSDAPPKPVAPVKKATAKKAADKSEVIELGFVDNDLLDEGELPTEWTDLGIKSDGPRIQHVKSGKQQYLLVDITTRGYEIYKLLRNAKGRRTEVEDAIVESTVVRPIGVDEADWQAQQESAPAETPQAAATEDDWDVESAGEPPAPTLKTQEATPVADGDDEWDEEDPASAAEAETLAKAETTGADDDWDDEAVAAQAEQQAFTPDPDDEITRLRAEIDRLRGEGEVPAATEPEKSAKPVKKAAAKKTAAPAEPVKRKWMAEVLNAADEAELTKIYKDAKRVGEWNERLTKAAKTRKAELLAQAAAEADDDDNW